VPIPGRENGDYQLIVRKGGVGYYFHVHPPKVRGQGAVPGEVMRGHLAMGRQTPLDMIDAILNIKGRPGGW
jgi:hypothetical protein